MGKSWISSSSHHYQPHHHRHHQHHDFVDHVCLRWVCEALDLIRVNYCQQKCLLSINLYSHAQPIISFLSDPRPIIAWPCNQLTPVVETWWIWLWLKTSCCCCCCWCWYWEKNCQRVDDSCQLGNNLTKTLHSSTTVWNFLLKVWSYFWRSFVGWNIVFPQEFVDEITSKYCQPCFGKAKRIMVVRQSRESS